MPRLARKNCVDPADVQVLHTVVAEKVCDNVVLQNRVLHSMKFLFFKVATAGAIHNSLSN